MRDDPVRHHIGTVTNPCRVVANRGGSDAKFLQIVETGNSRAIAANAGIVEDCGTGVQSSRKVGGIGPTMGGIHHHRAGGFRPDPSDAVSDDDRRSHRGVPHVATIHGIMPVPTMEGNHEG